MKKGDCRVIVCCLVTVLWMRNDPHRLMCLNPGPQQVALVGDVIESLGGGAFLEEVHHWGSALKAYSLAPFPVCSASCLWFKIQPSASCSYNMPICCHVFPPWWTLIPLNQKPNQTLSKVTFVHSVSSQQKTSYKCTCLHILALSSRPDFPQWRTVTW